MGTFIRKSLELKAHHAVRVEEDPIMKRLPTGWARFHSELDYQSRLALVVERESPAGPELVGVGRYEPAEDPARVDVAFVIEDGWQRMGLGTRLFNALPAAAEARGIRQFTADVLADNVGMLSLITRFGHVESRRMDSGILSLAFTSRPADGAGADPPRGARGRLR